MPHRGALDVLTEQGELRCDVAGRLYEESSSPADLPVVGDWVAVAPRPAEDAGTIVALLPRRTKFSRKTAWQATEEQVLAANLDVVFIVTSLNEDLNLRRLERYLILGRLPRRLARKFRPAGQNRDDRPRVLGRAGRDRDPVADDGQVGG